MTRSNHGDDRDNPPPQQSLLPRRTQGRDNPRPAHHDESGEDDDELITARRSRDPARASRQASQPPAPQDILPEGSDDDDAARQLRSVTADTMQSTATDLSKKMRKETLGIFDPDNPDDRDNQGLITTSSGKKIHTDVFMFCEHHSVFKRFGNDSLKDYYVGMLAGKASAWMTSELDSASRTRLLSLLITEFSRKLTERLKRPDTNILDELHKSRYTRKLAGHGITLAQEVDLIDVRTTTSLARDDVTTKIERSEMTDTETTDHHGHIRTPGRATIKSGSHRHREDRDRHGRSRDNDYIRKGMKEEKKVHWGRKYPVMEEEDKLGADRADTDSDNESVCSSRSTSSQDVYFNYMTGNATKLDDKEQFCTTCHRSFPTRTILSEHGNARACVAPAQLASEHAPARTKRCVHCHRDLASRNKLHRHTKNGCEAEVADQEVAPQVGETVTSTNETPVRTHHPPQVCDVDGNYTHLKFDAMSSPGGETVSVCADTGCGKPVVAREWLQTLDHTIETKTPVFIRGVNGKVGKPHSEWATFKFYVNGLCHNGSDAGYAEFTCGAWIQDGIPASSPRALLENGWIAPYGINVMTTEKRLHCTSLNDFFIAFTISQLSRRVRRRVIVARPTVVPAGQTCLVPASWKEVPKGRTFMFNGCVVEASDALVNSDPAPGVVIVNNSDKDITFQRKQKLGNIEECEGDQMYFSSTWKAAGLALMETAGLMASGASDGTPGNTGQVAISSEICQTPKVSAVAAGEIVPKSINTPSTSVSESILTVTTADTIRDVGSAILEDIKDSKLSYKQQKKNKELPLSKVGELLNSQPQVLDGIALASPVDREPELVVRESLPESPHVPYQLHVQRQPNLPEIETPNGIHIYDDGSGFARQAQNLCTRYATLWIDSGLIHVPEGELMTVPLVDNWHEPRIAQRPYACGLKDRNLIDQPLDKLHDQKRMEWVTKPTPFAAPVFVVWRIVDGKPKGGAVVDLRALNKVTIPDSYPLPRQEDIITALRGATHISAIDASSFFFQFGVALEHRDRFTITSHRGLERSTVAPMGFCNSPAYAQWYMDRLLRPYRSFCRAFIDDIVMFYKSAEEHARHMDTLFRLFVSKNLSISPTESWIGYPSAQVLGFRVDALGLLTTAERIAAFAKLEFPRQFAALGQYIGATGYIRHVIPYHAKIMEPLQKRKVALLAEGRKNDKIKIAFQTIQEQIASGKGLVHLDPKKRLFLQLDASIQRGFGAVLYHVKDGYIWKEGSHIPSNVTMPICFISKTLTAAETRYGPTELEMAALVWAMKRLKAHVASSEGFLTVFTDHSATKQIVEKTTLDTTGTDRANRRLVNASIYLSEYELRVFHIPGKKDFVPDALSRLEAPETDGNARRLRLDYTALDDVYMGVESLMSKETKDKFIQGYIDDTKYLPILKMILNSTDKPVDANRLHSEDAVSASKRGLPPVPSAGSPWAIEGIDLFDQLMTVTCTASKRNILVPGYATFSAEDWAVALARQLMLADWGMPKVIVSDRDRKFTSPFWRKLWRTKTSAHEFLYGFKPMSALDTVIPMEDVASLFYLREIIWKEVQLAMDFVAMKGKRWYDDNHRPIALKEGDRVYLRLHDGYTLPGKRSKKWSQQRTGPFRIKRVVNDLAYELELPDQGKIHPVISSKHLVPAHADDHVDEQPGPVEDEPIEENRYEVEFIVKREVRYRGRRNTPFEGFMVRWKGWGPEHDQWVKTADISKELIEDFRKKHPEQFDNDGPRRSGRKKKIPKKIN
ncbi:TY3B-TY3B protein [Fusarium bulbicola]|nr:TY3B-TY3B protein [Fusarium bulbicola]